MTCKQPFFNRCGDPALDDTFGPQNQLTVLLDTWGSPQQIKNQPTAKRVSIESQCIVLCVLLSFAPPPQEHYQDNRQRGWRHTTEPHSQTSDQQAAPYLTTWARYSRTIGRQRSVARGSSSPPIALPQPALTQVLLFLLGVG